MNNICYSLTMIRGAAFAGGLFVVLFSVAFLTGCTGDLPADPGQDDNPYQFETTGEEFLISALEEVESISQSIQRGGTLPPKARKKIISSSATDTAYIYGEITTEGYGAVVTERHTYPKGLLLITVRKSYGKPLTRIVTETKRYITYEDFQNDSTQQSNITEFYGLSADTLITHVIRNGILETYTFRLPVITRTTNPVDGSVRVTSRYGSSGTVTSETRDGDGNIIQYRSTYGDSSGALTTYTEYADSSWRNVRTVGQSDGSILREITSGP